MCYEHYSVHTCMHTETNLVTLDYLFKDNSRILKQTGRSINLSISFGLSWITLPIKDVLIVAVKFHLP